VPGGQNFFGYFQFFFQISIPIITNERCKEWIKIESISESQLCAGYNDGKKDACQVVWQLLLTNVNREIG